MNLSEQLSLTAEKYPLKAACVFKGQETSYLELDRLISRFADGLSKLGYRKGDHLALIMGNSPSFIIGLYGALRLGVTIIPINPIYTAHEMDYILTNGDVKGIVTTDMPISKFESLTSSLEGLEHIIVVESEEKLRKESYFSSLNMESFTSLLDKGDAKFCKPELDKDDTAVILYTSGTTGKPKGAMLTHKNLYSNAKDTADYLGIGERDKVIAALPMFHVFCLTVALNAPLMNGATVLIMPSFSPEEVFRLAHEQRATIFAGVPTMYSYLFQTPGGRASDFSHIRLCISGGAAMPVALLQNFEEKFKVKISEGYGLSEASPVTCFNPLDRERKPGSIGTSIVNVENKVVDEFGKELPVGEIGELIVKGPNVMAGYYNMPEETAVTLKNGWLHTGDMARIDEEGYFYIVDRRKDMILVGGYNVYPREVEEVLYQHPDVQEAAVIGRPDSNMGEVVIGFIVTNNPKLDTEDLKAYCLEFLAEYKIPVKIEIIEELPKNTTGKILKNALRSQLTSSWIF